jgi:hypothetical protein
MAVGQPSLRLEQHSLRLNVVVKTSPLSFQARRDQYSGTVISHPDGGASDPSWLAVISWISAAKNISPGRLNLDNKTQASYLDENKKAQKTLKIQNHKKKSIRQTTSSFTLSGNGGASWELVRWTTTDAVVSVYDSGTDIC